MYLDGYPWPQLALVQDVDGHLHRLRLGVADTAVALRVTLFVPAHKQRQSTSVSRNENDELKKCVAVFNLERTLDTQFSNELASKAKRTLPPPVGGCSVGGVDALYSFTRKTARAFEVRDNTDTNTLQKGSTIAPNNNPYVYPIQTKPASAQKHSTGSSSTNRASSGCGAHAASSATQNACPQLTTFRYNNSARRALTCKS